jgi:hypothetical protein
MSEIEKAEHVLNNLRQKRDALVAHGVELGEESAKISFAAHTGDTGARQRLNKLNAEIALHESELRSIDAAIAEAEKRLAGAERAEAQAADRVRAEEARKHIDELEQVFQYVDKHLGASLRGLIAIERGVEELHLKDVAFPSDTQLRLGIVAVIGTFLQQLPKTWWNELSAGLRYRSPADRQSAMSYWGQIEPSLRRQITQRTGEAPVSARPTKQKEVA